MLSSKNVFIVDMDSTILRTPKIGYFSSLELLEDCVSRGIIDSKYGERLAFMHNNLVNNDWALDRFYEEVIFLYRQAFKGLKVEDLQAPAQDLAKRIHRRVSPFVWELFLKMKMRYCTILISGSLHIIVKALADIWGFDYAVGTELITDNGLYNGQSKSVYGRKWEWVEKLIKSGSNNLTTEELIGIGDSYGDFDYLQKAAYSIAINAESKLYSKIIKRPDQIIVREDLGSYYFEKGRDIFVQLLKNNMCKTAHK